MVAPSTNGKATPRGGLLRSWTSWAGCRGLPYYGFAGAAGCAG